MSYTERSKRLELCEFTTRFLFILSPPKTGTFPPSHRREKDKGKEQVNSKTELEERSKLVGYCSFRFDTEETLGSRDAEVIYWFVSTYRLFVRLMQGTWGSYELQLVPAVRGFGLGKVLMDEFERIGRASGMDKGMLTCLKSMCGTLRRFFLNWHRQYDRDGFILQARARHLPRTRRMLMRATVTSRTRSTPRA
jgi:GNAT superfamily N-acetyltransferase